MSMAATAEMQATHQDRPIAKKLLPLRRIPWIVGGNQGYAIEYDTPVPCNGKSVSVPNQIVIEKPSPGLYCEPIQVFAFQVSQLMDDYYRVEAERDGLLAKIDTLTTDKVLLEREVEKLGNQLAESKRQATRNGKKD